MRGKWTFRPKSKNEAMGKSDDDAVKQIDLNNVLLYNPSDIAKNVVKNKFW